MLAPRRGPADASALARPAPGATGRAGRPALITLTVTSRADSGTGTLRDSITTANHDTADEYVINFGVTGTINLATALPDLDNNITIQGPGASSLTVQRDAMLPSASSRSMWARP